MTSKAIGPAHESHPLLQKQHANFWRSFVVRFNQPGESQQEHCDDLLHIVIACDAKVK